MKGKDLGTYYLRVELMDGRGWIGTWGTSARYTHGTADVSPIDAQRIPPTWASETELFECMVYQYLEGNDSCDCNKVLFLSSAYQQDIPKNTPCGDTMKLKRLTAIRPDGSEYILYEKSKI